MNSKKEGEYYSQMVRKYREEYGGKNLHDFCIKEKVSYPKMLHCLRTDSYRKPTPTGFVKPMKEQALHPLVVDGMPRESQVSVLSFDQAKGEQPSVNIPRVEISLSSKIHVNLHDCSVKTLLSLIKEMEVSLC
jgi:hypothetical protein